MDGTGSFCPYQTKTGVKVKFSDFEKIAKELGLSPHGIERALGSLWVEVGSSDGQQRRLNLGLRLVAVTREQVWVPTDYVVSALREYQGVCPQVFRWIVSGGFNPGKIPAELSYPQVLHASRTSGRVRASLLRKLSRF